MSHWPLASWSLLGVVICCLAGLVAFFVRRASHGAGENLAMDKVTVREMAPPSRGQNFLGLGVGRLSLSRAQRAGLTVLTGLGFMGAYSALAQGPGSVGAVVIEGLTSQSASVRLPALPTGATGYKLQRATRTVTAAIPPAAGRLAWFTADSLSGLSDGDPITTWGNLAGGGHAAAPANASSRPTYVAHGLNGRPVVRFDGTDDYFSLPPSTWNFREGLSAFVVTRPQSAAYWSHFFDFGNGPGNQSIYLGRVDTSTSAYYSTFSNTLYSGFAGSSALTGGALLLEAVQQGGAPGTFSNAQIFKDGTEVGSGSCFVPLDVTRTSNYIAKSNWNDPLFQGDIAEILLYNTALSTTARQDVEQYVARKYALGLASDTLTWSDVATSLSGNALYEDSGLTADTTYWYRCVTEDATPEQTGPALSVTTLPLAPAAPAAPQSESIAATRAVLSAPALPVRASHLELQQKEAGQSDSAYVTVVPVFSGSATVTGLTAQTGYVFRCVAVGEGGRTPGSTLSLTTTALDPPAAPGAPTIGTVTASSVALQLPALPAGASTLSVQRAAVSAPTSPPTDPAQGLQLWLRADSASGLTSGSPLAQWNNSGAAGGAATQSQASLRPLWMAGAANGRPAVRLDGNDDYYQLPARDDIRTAFVVVKHATGAQDWAPLLGATTNHWHGGPGTNLFWWEYTSDPVKNGQTFLNGQPLSALAMSKPTSLSLISIVTTSPVRVDSIATQVGFGGRAWNGDYAEVLLYNTALSTAERQSAEAYLLAKYNLGSAPAGLSWTTIATGKSAGESLVDTGLDAETRYFYRCVAVGDGGETPGASNSATTLPLAPAAPAAPVIDQIGQHSLRVQAPALPARGLSLILQKKLAAQDDAAYQNYAEGVGAGDYTIVSGLAGNSAYDFRYLAANAGGTTPGAVGSATTLPAPPDAPGAPTFSQLAPTSLQVHLPPLPALGTSLTLQRAIETAPTAPPSAGLNLWLRADAVTGVANGGSVATWNDSSGAGHNVSQSQVAWRPTLVASGLNGHPVLRFNGNSQFLTSGWSGPGGSQATFFVVAKGANYQSLVHFQTGGDYLVYPWGGGGGQTFINSNDGGTTGLNCGLVANEVNIGAATWKAGQVGGMRTYRNGALVAQRDSSNSALPNGLLRVGSHQNIGEFPTADVAEILVYNTALSDADRLSVERYLACKYAVSSAPPADLDWTTLATGLSGQATYPQIGLTSNTHYWYRAVAVGSEGSTPGAAAGVTTPEMAPAAPEAPSFGVIGATHLQVIAPALPARAVSLRLEKKLDGEPDTSYVEVASGITGGASTTVTGLSPLTAYSFRFVALNSGGEVAGPGAAVTTHEIDPPGVPAAPSVTHVSHNSVRLQIPALPIRAQTLSLQRALVPAPAPTAPLTSGLQLWLKADGIKGLANGAPIATWNDSSGQGQNATQTQAARRPLWTQDALNGRPVVRLDGNDDYLDLPDQTGIRTAFVVARHRTGNQTWAPLLGSASYYFHGGIETNLFHSDYTSPEVRNGQTFFNGQEVSALQITKPTSFGLLSLVTAGPVTVNSLATQINTGDLRNWNGDYAEVLLYNTVLSAAQRQSVEEYLMAKYGLGEMPSGLTWTTIQTGLTGEESVLDSGRAADTRYFYRCVAQGVGGTTPGQVTSALTLSEPTATDGLPDPPAAPTVKSVAATSVNLQLPDLSAGATSLSLQRATGPAFAGPPSSGLNLWLKADAVTGVADGAPLETWTDSSSAARSVTQSEVWRRPTWVASAINGRPALRFNGSGQYFSSNYNGPGGTETTLFVVAKGSQYQSMVRFQYGGGSYLVYPWTLEDPQKFINGNDGGTGAGIACGLVPNEVNIGTALWKSGTTNGMRTYRNGQLVAQRDTNGANLPTEGLRIGAYGDGWGEFSNADIAEILVYNTALSDEDRQSVEAYLARKYNAPVPAPEGLNWSTIATNRAGASLYTDANLTTGTTYWYRCLAVGPGGQAAGAATSAVPQAASALAPEAPDAPTFQDIEPTSLKVIAPALPAHATSLTLQKKLSTEADTAYVDVATDLAGASVTPVTGLTPQTAYRFHLVAVGDGGSTAGDSAQATTLTAAQPPGAPDAPTFQDIQSTTLKVIAPALPVDATSLTLQKKLATEADTAYVDVATQITGASSTQVGNLAVQTAYHFRFVAVGTGGSTAGDSAQVTTLADGLSAPADFQASGGNAQVLLSWNQVSGALGYRIYRSTTSNSFPATPFTSVSGTSYTDIGRTNGTTYYYIVKAYNDSGDGPPSNQVEATPSVPATPFIPTDVTATAGDAKVKVQWTPVPGAIYYRIYRSTDNGATFNFRARRDDNVLIDESLINGTTYWYFVRAMRPEVTEGPSSTYVSATPQEPDLNAAPGLAPEVTARPGNAKVVLSWPMTVIRGATGYRIYRSTTSNSFPATPFTSVSGTSYTDIGRTNGTTYYYIVKAYNDSGDGPPSSQVEATPSALPDAPSGLTASAGDRQVALSWDSVGGATSYGIRRSSAADGSSTVATGISGTTYTDSGLSNGTTYTYRVYATNQVGAGTDSAPLDATPIAAPLSAPGQAPSVSVVAADAQLTLSWNAISGATEYQIFRSTTSNSFPTTASFTATTTSVVDAGLTNGTSYFYVIRAANSAGSGPASAQAEGTPGAATVAPEVVSGLVAQGGHAKITLTWPAVAGATSYTVKRSTIANSATATTIASGVTLPSYVDEGLTSDRTYYYRVFAKNAVGVGPYSEEVNATTLPEAPDAGPDLTLYARDASVQLYWSAVGGATSYRVFRSSIEGQFPANPLVEVGPRSIMDTGPDWLDTTVANGTTYYYIVKACNSGGVGPASAVKSVTPAAAPAAVMGLTATAADGQVRLSWNAVEGAAYYFVYHAETSGNFNNFGYQVQSNSYIDKPLVNGRTYYYVVKAVNSVGEGPASDQVQATPLATPPGGPPQGVPVLSGTPGNASVTLSSTGVNGATSYKLFRSTTSGLYPNDPIATQPSFVDYLDAGPNNEGLTNGTTYYYVVKASNDAGDGPASVEWSAKPVAPSQPPTGLTATLGDGQVLLSWNAVEGALSYKVERATSPEGEYLEMDNPLTPTFTDYEKQAAPYAIINGTTYYYVVSARNAGGLSERSAALAVTPLGEVTGLTASSGDTQVALSWSTVVGATGYKIFRSTVMDDFPATPFTSVAGLSYTNVGLTNGATYYYKVQAYQGDYYGPLSAPVIGKPSSTPVVGEWGAGSPINCGGIAWPTPQNTIQAGHTGQLSAFLATDFDQHTTWPGGTPLTQMMSDPCSYTWQVTGGTFKSGRNKGQSVEWIAPTTPGTYTIRLTVNDQNQANQSPGEAGGRGDAALSYNDDPVSFSVSITVLP